MIVSNNSLLNILIPNENKTLKEVLKEADVKSLQGGKSTDVQDILKNLMESVTNKSKSNESIQDLLKNSSVFKDLGNFPKDLENLIKNLPQDEKLSQLKSTLQSFLTDIKDLDENKLKELVQKSGIFLESKIANSTQNPNITKLNELLLQVKELIKNDTSPQAKALNTLIDKIMSQNQEGKPSPTLNQDVKQTIQLLKEIVNQPNTPNQNKIVQLTQQLEQMNQNVKLADSKLQNSILPQESKQSITAELKPLLNNLKTELLQSKQPLFEPIIKQIDSLLQSKDMFAKNMNSVEPKALLQQLTQSPMLSQAAQEVPKINTILSTLQQQTTQIQTLENALQKSDISAPKIQELQQQIKTTLTQLQSALSEVKGMDTKPLTAVIDKLISMPNLFSKLEIPQTLQQQLSSATSNMAQQPNTKSATATESIKPNVQTTTTPSSATQTVEAKGIQAQTTEVKTATQPLQDKATLEIKLSDGSNAPKETSKPTESLSSQLQRTEPNNLQNELKPILNNLSENIKSIVNAVKSSLLQLGAQNQQMNPQASPENLQQFEMLKIVQKVESLLQGRFEQIQQQLMQTQQSPKDALQDDIKSALLQLQQESLSNPKMQELSKQVERLLTHIDYYQLLSITSNSNYLYLPFIWDMLEDGSICMKQLKEDRYFCEIHLTLKEFGKMDLLLGLYEENHIDISIFTNEDFVKKLIQEHMVELRVGLNRAGLIPQNITLLELKDEQTKDEVETSYNQNPYSNDDLGFGVNIKV